MKVTKTIAAFLMLSMVEVQSPKDINRVNTMEKRNYYCEYCGNRFPDVRFLTSGTCPRHPDGSNKGRHKLYEGTEKQKYTCKYCGKQFPKQTNRPCPPASALRKFLRHRIHRSHILHIGSFESMPALRTLECYDSSMHSISLWIVQY